MRSFLLVASLILFSACIETGCLSCDDGNPCTHDSCSENECVHRSLSGPVEGCSGSGGCVEYTCSAGSCILQKTVDCCGNGVCDGGESHETCPMDCGMSCFDGVRNQGEDQVDCGGPCDSCEDPEMNYLKKLSSLRDIWRSSTGNYTVAVRAFNEDRDMKRIKSASLKSYSEADQVRAKLARVEPAPDLDELDRLFNETLALYMLSLRSMIYYADTSRDSHRVDANRILADALDRDRQFVALYNDAVDRYNLISINCLNHELDGGEEGVDCGSICRRPCTEVYNVTKYIVVRSEGSPSNLVLNVSAPAVEYPPYQRVLGSYQHPSPARTEVDDEGNRRYVYDMDLSAYGVEELWLTETVELTRAPRPVRSDAKYFNSVYLLGDDFSETTDDICFRARMLKGNLSDTHDVVDRFLSWIIENVNYELNDEELGAQYCYVHRRGACDEHADLFVSMSRCVGIPARRVTGSLVNASQLRGHAWAEYYDGGWYYIDPSIKKHKQAYILDNKHIATCIGEGISSCGIGYTYTYTSKKPNVRIDERLYLS
ncbi:MAG: hypothetical protein GF416_00500 [Candidatus Altiarchaeales archaeon]|nr:hypothetical protein [Candidatus Altiarchaeales archaeon]MBD3415598.1 hypothetical protein [Candidatus Altiarchaeales archaeon]